MKILVIADEVSRTIYSSGSAKKFSDVDCVVSCGDLPDYYMEFVVSTFNVPCYYVPGNHDDTFEKNPPKGWLSLDGKVVRFGSLRLMGLGGSMYYNGKSPFQYTDREMWMRYLKLWPKLLWNRNQVDIFVSHAPAFELGDMDDLPHRGFKVFRRILERFQPRFFLHGHVHLNYGNLERTRTYQNTKIINGFQHYILDLENKG